MNTKDIGTIRRMMGVIDCVMVSQSKEIQTLLRECLEGVGYILDKEEENNRIREEISRTNETIYRLEQKVKGIEKNISIEIPHVELPKTKYYTQQKEGDVNDRN